MIFYKFPKIWQNEFGPAKAQLCRSNKSIRNYIKNLVFLCKNKLEKSFAGKTNSYRDIRIKKYFYRDLKRLRTTEIEPFSHYTSRQLCIKSEVIPSKFANTIYQNVFYFNFLKIKRIFNNFALYENFPNTLFL
jgi:hypothetical protein